MLLSIHNRWAGLTLLVMGLASLVLFLYGFFPLKYHSGKLSHMDDLPNFIDGISIDGQQVYNSGENTVILMVIDGLRYDFVTEEYMPYAGELLKNKSACIYVSIAEPPTVTMPRIKAMMTGSVSTFADVALNFGAPAVRGDSVLRVAKSRGRRSVMYGDDTWLRLFPGLWAESDGTTSFYVTDYTEVDNNVTRHLDKILTADEDKKPTFDFLVLHYLGLDHIGHLEGARSPKIRPKLLEMDAVIKKIFTSMQSWARNGVLIVCGDHGMRDAGGHGGASASEVLVPLLIARSSDFNCPHPLGRGPQVAQVDMAPSIAWLLGAPPPGDSTGRILPALLPEDTRQHLYLLHVIAEHNTKQSLPTDTEFYKQFKRAEKQFAHYLVTGQLSAAKISKEFYEESLEKMSEYLSETTVNFDMFAIGIAIVLLYMIATSLLCVTLYSLQPEFQHGPYKRALHQTTLGTVLAFIIVLAICTATLVTACFISETKSPLCSFSPLWIIPFSIIPILSTIIYFLIKSGLEKIKDLSSLNYLNSIDYLLVGGTVFHSFSFFGTSFIEEEHMTWYFLWNTLMFFVLIRTLAIVVMYLSKRLSGATEVQEKPHLAHKMAAVGVGIVPKWVLLIALHRYLRTMNQTGDRWLFLPDTADWLNAPENSFYLQAHLVLGTLGTLVVCLYNTAYMSNSQHVHTAFTVCATACIFIYRMIADNLVSPFEDIKLWDPVTVVNIFWTILLVQFIFEILSYIGAFKSCSLFCSQQKTNMTDSKKFVYNLPKAKSEDIYMEEMDEPWNLDEVKLNLVRSLTHLMFNDMMLIVVLLMRPHNVVMVPSIFVTCKLTYECMDHKLLDSKSVKRTEVVDILSRTLVHMWIGMLFFFYQGNSNSLASVDLGSGYVGLRSYQPALVAARMGLHAYAGPALAGAALYCTLATRAHSWTQYLDQIRRATSIMALHRVYAVVVYCIVATIFRHHLFVWSVFSPKLLYDFVATVFTVQALATIAQIEVFANVTNWLAKMFAYRPKLRFRNF